MLEHNVAGTNAMVEVALMSEPSAPQRAWNWPFWTVLLLALPSFMALVIMISMFVRPSVWAYALIPLLYFYIPVTLILAIVVFAATHRFMRRSTVRRIWATLASAVFAVLATVTVLMWAGSRTH
jgi:hypothetical protein